MGAIAQPELYPNESNLYHRLVVDLVSLLERELLWERLDVRPLFFFFFFSVDRIGFLLSQDVTRSIELGFCEL